MEKNRKGEEEKTLSLSNRKFQRVADQTILFSMLTRESKNFRGSEQWLQFCKSML